MSFEFDACSERFQSDGQGRPVRPERNAMRPRPSAEALEGLRRMLLAARLGLGPRFLVARWMTRAGIPAAIVAVYRKTGLLFRSAALHAVTTQELVDWHRASLVWERETGRSIERCWITEEEYWELAERGNERNESSDAITWRGASAAERIRFAYDAGPNLPR